MSASPLAVERPAEAKPVEGCHSRESGNPESNTSYYLGFSLSGNPEGACVIPAQAGIQEKNNWIPTFVGMTYKGDRRVWVEAGF
jgi:hypothetical protein